MMRCPAVWPMMPSRIAAETWPATKESANASSNGTRRKPCAAAATPAATAYANAFGTLLRTRASVRISDRHDADTASRKLAP